MSLSKSVSNDEIVAEASGTERGNPFPLQCPWKHVSETPISIWPEYEADERVPARKVAGRKTGNQALAILFKS